MAASCREILSESFPTLDTEVLEYVNGIVGHGAEDFESQEEFWETIGPMLMEVDCENDEDSIRHICDRLYRVMNKGRQSTQNGPLNKILGAPVHLGSMISSLVEESAAPSVWLTKKEKATTVDQKKLEKAEQKIREKIDKRENRAAPPKSNGSLDTASASQQSSRRENKMENSGTNKSYDVRIENFDVAFGERSLIQGADIMLAYGRRYGLVGRNGIGKTTLLRMIADKSLRIPAHIRVLHVEQEVVGDDTEALHSVLECDIKREALLKEEKEISAKLSSTSPSEGGGHGGRLTELYQELEAIEADKAPAKAGMILAGLGFTPAMQKQTTRTFSGGWRMRLALARALFSKPDLLLLDEPTNMLDMKAIIWLENYLQTWVSTIFVVSHDRAFLNSVVTDIHHLHNKVIDTYKGNFEMFTKTREEKLKSQQREYEAQKQYRDHIQVFIDRFRYNANRASQVQSKLKLLEKLPPLIPVEKDSEVTLRFPEAEKLNGNILQLDEVTFYYSKSKPIFKNIDVSATMDSRICIVGENGAGKTTLLKVLLGELDPVSGIRHAHRNLRIGYFSQHHIDQLDLGSNSVEVLQAKFPGKPSEFYRTQLGSFGVSGELAVRPVNTLSGGQKSRVAFANMCMLNPNFFILDEPTNHLDMETIEALGRALNKFQGGVILVSHDERLIRVICSELWVCSGGKVTSLEGGIDQYKKIVEDELEAQG